MCQSLVRGGEGFVDSTCWGNEISVELWRSTTSFEKKIE